MKRTIVLLVIAALAASISAACNPAKLFDAELTMLYDDVVNFELVPKRLETTLNTQRFGPAKQQEALQYFNTRFGFDFSAGPNSIPGLKLESGSFEGYNVYSAVTSKSRYHGAPLIRVFFDVMTVTALDGSKFDAQTNQPIAKESIAQYGYYTLVYNSNNTQFTAPIKAKSSNFMFPWRDSGGNLDYSRNILLDLESPEWGIGLSQGIVLMPMPDASLGKSQISVREWMRFPPNLETYQNTGKVTTCQSLL